MSDNNLSGRVGLSTDDFKTGLAGMNRELRVLESGFRASAAGLGDWANDATGLELRIKSLTGQMEVQQRKVEALRAEYKRVADEKGVTSRAAQDLEIKLNRETETLGKMKNELDQTEISLQELQDGSQDAGKGLDEMGGKAESLKGVLSGLWAGVQAGVAVLMAAAAAVIAVGAAIGGLVFSSAEAAGQLADLSAKTGISTTRLQELQFIGGQTGVTLDTITGANARLIRSIGAALDPQSEQAKSFAAIGVSVTDANGKLRDSEAVFADVITALGGIENPTQRDLVAMSLLGRGAQELNPLILAGTDGMAAMTDKAHELGAVMSEETVAGLEAFDDTVAGLKLGLQGTLGTLATAFLPGFQGVFNTLGGYLGSFAAIVSGSGGDLGQIASGLSGLVGEIVSDMAAQAPALLKSGMDILMSILNGFMANLPAILTAVTTFLTSLITFLVQALPVLFQAGVQILLVLLTAIIQNLPMLIGAALQMVIALVQGLAAAMPTLIPAIVEMLKLVILTIIENLPLLLDAALQLILGLVQGIMAALPILIEAWPTVMIAIVDALIAMLPVIVDAAPEIIVALVSGIIGALPALGEAIPQIISMIVSVIFELLPELIEAGAEIMFGIWEGMAAQLPWFWEQLEGFALGIWGAIKDALGIASPSKLFADTVGPNIPAGIWEGIEGGMPKLNRQLAAAMRGLTTGLDVSVTGRYGAAGFGSGAGGVVNNVGDIIIQVGENASPLEVGRAAEQGVLKALRAVGG